MVLCCKLPGMTISKVSLAAFTFLGPNLIGTPVTSIVQGADNILTVQSITVRKRHELKKNRWAPRGYSITNVGEYEIAGASVRLLAVHLQPEPQHKKEEGLFMIMIPRDINGLRRKEASDAGSSIGSGGIFPSDSVSHIGRSNFSRPSSHRTRLLRG